MRLCNMARSICVAVVYVASVSARLSAPAKTDFCTAEQRRLWHHETCDAAQPAWVAKYSMAAAGPEQLWLNYGATPDTMVIGWATSDDTASSTVEYGTKSGVYGQSATGTSDYYTYSAAYTSPTLHHATMTGLAPATKYFYRVGDDATGYSDEYSFMSNPGAKPTYPFALGLFGDIGESANAEATLQHMIEAEAIDAFQLNGDISYASGCESNGCITWDAFMRMMQPLAATKPIGVEIGNHEMDDYANGMYAISSQYRFAGMPFPKDSADGVMYFSYNAGPMHLISLASFFDGGFGSSSPMTQWLKADIAAIDHAATPWVVVSVHAPWYNSNSKHQGDGEDMRAAYEQLLLDAGASIVTSGHVHSYQRSQPVLDNSIMSEGKGMVHLNLGDAGASLYTKWLATPDWDAYHSAEFGHGMITFLNDTHAYMEWNRNADSPGGVSDDTFIINVWQN